MFDQPIIFASRQRSLDELRDVPTPTTSDGIVPGRFYIVRKKGVVEVGIGARSGMPHAGDAPMEASLKARRATIRSGQGFAWRIIHSP